MPRLYSSLGYQLVISFVADTKFRKQKQAEKVLGTHIKNYKNKLESKKVDQKRNFQFMPAHH